MEQRLSDGAAVQGAEEEGGSRGGRAEEEGGREEQGANSTQKSKVSSRKNERVSMAEGSKPDVPLFQLLTDLLQQVRYASMAADLSIDPVPPWPPIWGKFCLAAALIFADPEHYRALWLHSLVSGISTRPMDTTVSINFLSIQISLGTLESRYAGISYRRLGP